ncbi:hypothetical protein D9619_007083 [Psilocybe cf. subviscida]|uniref:Nucleoprotein TPR/MLP1 domain-containing protein n=1 Tax=Psilocybe cf. subviscida TaxID=2480587 RepID=A0A8H5B2J0_9AGAR|nr:hypothetical protein D9619_007083 [Psilocybe cf. subviscida]
MTLTTRRQSKAAAAAQDTDDEGDRHLNVAIPEDIDEDMLSSILPDLDFAAVSVNDILTLYRQLISQAVNLDSAERDRDEFRAELERKDIELDQALQDKESISKELETSAEAVHEELKKVKHERDHLAETNAVLQAKLTDLENMKSSSSHESDGLKRKVEDTEREKRDLVVVISRLKDESTQRDEEVQSLRASLKEARQEHQALESQVRELRSAETTTNFKLDSLSQHLQLAQGEAERAVSDLSTKTEEFTKYRRAKHTEVATLQASFDSLSQAHAAMEASYKALQSSHTSQSHQLTQSLSKVQELTVLLAEQESRYSSEANNLKRLISLMEDRESQAKSVVETFERDFDAIKERADRREAALVEETEKEKRAREVAEKRLEQLEQVLERVGRGEFPTPGGISAPSTPFRTPGTPGFVNDGMMGLSPTVAMASRTQRSGKTFTEVYADYVRLQEEYAKKCGEYDNMDRTLSSVLAQIEERAPILSQQRLEYERLKGEAQQLGSQLSQAIIQRDEQAKVAHDRGQKLAESAKENSMLQRQLEDLGRQIQNLLRDIARRDDPTIPSDEEMENLTVEPVSDTQTMITNNLVLFKSIDGLQNQNQRLLKIVRDLAGKMENEEREYREKMEHEQAEAVKEAHEAIQDLVSQLEKQKQHYETLIQGYVRERDSFRVMLARAEKGLPVQQVNGAAGEPMMLTSGDDSNLARELAEVQQQFENYKTETSFDSGRTRQDLVDAQREVSRLGAALAKSEAQVEFLQDRHRMHEEKFRIHSTNLEELNKRNRILQDQNVRMEIEGNRLTDELEMHMTRVEQLRNESANLRAEKKIWESVQGRLVEENRSLAMERSHLSDLMNNVQKMHSDLERSGENDRRRLESQLQMLESQTQDLRAQVVQERDAVRHISLQKELESKDLQARLDKSVSEMSKTRESLIEAQTSKRHLEEKIEDLTRQMQGNVEKLSVYERRPSTATNSMSVDQDGTREQQLEAEVAELRSALKMAEVDLAAAKTHRDQYQEISQSNETALASLNTTFDEYKSELKSLQDRLEQASSELATLRTQHNEAQKTFEAERVAWINDKKTLEDTIVDMSTSEKHSESNRSSREQELRSLEEQAKAAEERYSREIIAHAESMKSLDALKKDLASAHAASRQHMSAAETAQAKLVSSETSWTQQKENLDQELNDLKARCKDLSEHNTTLHQHLESVTAQAARIRQAADAPDQPIDGENADSTDARLGEMRSVVNYLRKEKGIVDLQLELSKRDNEILKSQVERITVTLQETRAALTEERERAIQNTQSAAQHAELVERINQLNILRESNATLRGECESASKKARDLENKLATLSQELDPAKEQARTAQAEANAMREQAKRLEAQAKMWQDRNSQLLSKYDRIDPAEVQALKDEIEKLKAENAETTKRFTDLMAKFNNLKEINNRNNGIANKNKATYEANRKNLEDQISTLKATIETLQTEITALKATQAAAPPEAPPTPAPSEDQLALITSLRAERDALLEEKENWSKVPAPAVAEPGASGQSLEQLDAEKEELRKKLDEATQKVENFKVQIQRLNGQNAGLMERSTALMKKAQEDAEKHKAALAEALEKANANAPPPADSVDMKRHIAELKAQEEKLKAEYEAELKARVESSVQEALKDRPAPPSDGTFTPEQQAAVDAAIETHKEAFNKDIEAAVERGRKEIEMRIKLKDSQLTRAQNRVKELEMQVNDWVNKGLVTLPVKQPSTPTATSSAAPVASGASASTTAAAAVPNAPNAKTTTTAPAKPGPTPAKLATPATSSATAPQANSAQARPNPAAAAAAAAAANNTALPRRPPAAGAAPARGGVPVRGRGGAARGGALRQMPQKPTGQQAAPSATPPTAPAAATPATGGVSIIGAANKRPHDDAAAGENSLAKRLKPNGAP